MKLNKLFMLGLAGLAFAACSNDEEVAPANNGDVKSVALSLTNLKKAASRALEACQTGLDGEKVQLNSLQVYFTNDAKTADYTGKTADGSADAQTYFNAADLQAAGTDGYQEVAVFHFLPAQATKVVVVGNYAKDNFTKISEITAATLDIANEQDVTKLHLYGESEVLQPAGTDDEDHTPLFRADVKLLPRVSRIEIVDFEYTQVGTDARNYLSATVNQILLNHYYASTGLVDGTAVTAGKGFDLDKNIVVTQMLDASATTPDDATHNWLPYYNDDALEGVVMDETSAYKHAFANTALPAYNFFPTAEQEIGFRMTMEDAAVEAPTALVTAASHFSADVAKIYKVHLKFDDNDFKTTRCIQVFVDVEPWEEIDITIADFQ